MTAIELCRVIDSTSENFGWHAQRRFPHWAIQAGLIWPPSVGAYGIVANPETEIQDELAIKIANIAAKELSLRQLERAASDMGKINVRIPSEIRGMIEHTLRFTA